MHKDPVMGFPSIGKSEIIEQIGKETDRNVIDSDCFFRAQQTYEVLLPSLTQQDGLGTVDSANDNDTSVCF